MKEYNEFNLAEKLTFDQLPTAVSMLIKEVSEMRRLLVENQEQVQTSHEDDLLTIKQSSELLNLTVPTMYSKVSKGELPVMKRGKRLYFFRAELMDYIKEGRKKSNAEIEAEAEAYLSNKKKGLNNGK